MSIKLHGTAVAIGNSGILIRGKPGSGKSSLALALIDHPGRGLGQVPLEAALIADDQVVAEQLGGQVILSAPPILRGKLEIRGLGIVNTRAAGNIPLRLIIDLEAAATIPRLPEIKELQAECCGRFFPRIQLDPAGPGAAAKLRAAFCVLVARHADEA